MKRKIWLGLIGAWLTLTIEGSVQESVKPLGFERGSLLKGKGQQP